MLAFKEVQEIKEVFRREYRGQSNVMTPRLDDFGHSLKDTSLLFEISSGRGIFNDYLVGVTVLEMPESVRRHDLNTCFSGNDKSELLSQAREYAEGLIA
jgi:hypothetical protein